MPLLSKPKPSNAFEARPFASQTQVSFETPNTVVYDRKFDTALRASHMEQHYDRVNKDNMTRDDLLTTKIMNYPVKMVDVDTAAATHATIMTSIKSMTEGSHLYKLHNSATASKTARCLRLAFRNLDIQTGYLTEKLNIGTIEKIQRDFKKIKLKEVEDLAYINMLYDFSSWMLGVINASNKMYADYYKNLSDEDYIQELTLRNYYEYKPLGLSVSWSHQFCILSMNGKSVLLPKTYLLLLHNKTCDLISVLLYTKVAQYSSMPRGAYLLTVEFCSELWSLIIDMGQTGFSIVKCLEAFASGEALATVERWKNDQFLKVITKDLFAETGFDYMSSNIRVLWKKVSDPMKHELSGLAKIVGHPFVDMKRGAETIHQYTTEIYELDYDKINLTTCYIKQNYIRNHIFRTGHWPPHAINSNAAPIALRYASTQSIDPEGATIRDKYPPIVVRDYNFIEILPAMKFNNLENAIPHLKDKTISILRTEVIKKYVKHERVESGWSDTRLLLFYLLKDEKYTDHVEFINAYAAGEDIEEFINYLVIRIVPKEKEMKVPFRGFGCTTFQNRMLYLAQEKNAMEYLDMFCDEQAMTLGELELTKRLYAFRCLLKAYPRHSIIYIMIDASKWNNHFRRETCDLPMSETVDKVFGTKVFGRTHEKYQNTLFYVPDGDTSYHWEGQDGGIEGLNQDTWVITYIAQIKTALEGLDLKVHILCKGDDLRLAVMIPAHDDRVDNVPLTKAEILTRLSNTARDMGHSIKTEECYGSMRYFNFSKNASIDRVELPQAIRKIQKCYGATNAFLPSIDEYIASTFSNAHSACRATTNQFPAYFVALVWTFYYLLTDERIHTTGEKMWAGKIKEGDFIRDSPTQKHYAEQTDDQLVALSLTVSAVGGFPVIYLHNMMLRAESDLLPPFLDIMNYCERMKLHNIFMTMKNFLVYSNAKKTTWRPVYMDIYCIPINRPPTPSQVLRDAIIPALRKATKCSELKELFDLIDDEEASEKSIKALDSSPTVEAKVMSVLYSALPEAILGEICRKFESARSVLELLILVKKRHNTNRILRKVIAADFRLQQWRINRLLGEHDELVYNGYKWYDVCPAKFAYQVRCHSWGKPINGITMPPMAHLIGFCTQLTAQGNAHIISNHFTFRVEKPTEFIAEENNYHYGIGSLRPFLGHVTGTGTVNPLMHITEKDPFLTKLRNIAELATWTDNEFVAEDGTVQRSNIRILIEKISHIYTELPLNAFAPFLGSKKSGTVAHHVRVRSFREAIMPNSLSNIYQMMQGESNTHKRMAGDKNHYWINFLQIYCHSIAMLAFELNVSPYFTVPEVVWVPTANCTFCMRAVEEPPIIIEPRLVDKIKFPTLSITRLGSNTMRILKESLGLAKDRQYNIGGHETNISTAIATAGILKLLTAMTIQRTERLIDRYGQHPVNREGLQVMTAFNMRTEHRIIGQRELSRMDNDILADVFPYIVLELLLKKLTPSAIVNVSASLLTIPSNLLPWFPLVYELNRVGRVFALVKELAIRAEMPVYGLTYTPEQIAPYLGILAIKALDNSFEPPPLVMLSNYQLTDIRREVTRHLHNMNWARFNTEFNLELEGEIEDQRKIRQKNIALQATVITYIIRESFSSIMNETDTLENDMELNLLDLVKDVPWKQDLGENVEMEMDEEWIEENLWRQSGLYTRKISMSRDEYIMSIIDYINEAIFHIDQWINGTSFQCVITTALACIDTIRANGQIFREYFTNETDFDRLTPTGLSQLKLNVEPSRRIVTIRPIDEVESTLRPIMEWPATRPGTVVINSCMLRRPFGVNNATMNHLRYILRAIGFPHNVQDLSYHIMGDGLGNGTLYFAFLSRSSRFIFTTKPDDAVTHVYPDIAMDTIQSRGNQIYADHVATGYWDLSQPETFNYIEQQYGYHDVFFCDAEAPPGENAQLIGITSLVAEHYVRSRTEHGLLIMQLSGDQMAIFGKVITFLSYYSRQVLLIHPDSELCQYSGYIIAMGRRSVKIPKELQDCYPPPSVIASMNKFGSNKAEIAQEIRSKLTNHLHVGLFMSRDALAFAALPPLWVSLYVKLYNKAPSADTLTRIRNELDTTRNPLKLKSLRPLRLTSDSTYILNQLKDETKMDPNQHKYYQSDYHTTRIRRVQLLCSMWGFNDVLDIIQEDNPTRTEKAMRRLFLNRLEALPTRDYDPSRKYLDIYTRMMRRDNDTIRLNYWLYYVNGIHVAYSLVSWLSTGYSHLRAEAMIQKQRQADLE